MPKNKLKNMSQTHGHVDTFAPTTLNQIWGDDGASKYHTMDVDEYEKQLISMNKADLQAHAAKVGLVPIDDRSRLTKRLVQEFKLHVAAYRHPSVTRKEPLKISKDVEKILAEGR